jgi:hypothetical protein
LDGALDRFMSASVQYGSTNRALGFALRQAFLAGVMTVVFVPGGRAGQGASTPATATPASASHYQFDGVLRFLAPEAHAAPPHQHQTADESHHPAPVPHATVTAMHTPTAPVLRRSPAVQTAARDYAPYGRSYEVRPVSSTAYPVYAYRPYAYARYIYPVVAWQPYYGYRAVRYVYYYPYPGGYSGY